MLSNRERRGNIGKHQPFATPQEVQGFTEIWRQIALRDFSGKPEIAESTAEDEAELQQLLAEPEVDADGVTRRAKFANSDSLFWGVSALEKIDLIDGAEREERAIKMREKVGPDSDYRYTTLNKDTFAEASAENLHGVDFTREIEQRLAEIAAENRPVRVLVLGCDVGFFNDELRHHFGKKIEVFGTTIETAYTKIRKRRLVHAMRKQRNERVATGEHVNDDYLQALSDEMHPNDGKWRSIVQTSDFPEFDLIIDTFGEITYSCHNQKSNEYGTRLFQLTMRGALRKLMPGGKLYISDIDYNLTNDNLAEFSGEPIGEFTIIGQPRNIEQTTSGPHVLNSYIIERKTT